MDHQALHRISLGQYGLWTKQQAIECGASSRNIVRFHQDGRWRRIHPEVFTTPGRKMNDIQRRAAAVLAAGPDAAISHVCALAIRDVAPWPLHVHVTVGHGHRRSLTGVVWHQTRIWPPEDIVDVHGIACTTVERALLDCGTLVGSGYLPILTDECLRLGLTTVEDLALRSLQLRPDGRYGGAALRKVLANTPPIEADSVMETVLARALSHGGLGDYTHHHNIEAGGRMHELDFAWPDRLLNVETDGKLHDGPEQQAWDLARDTALHELGWTVLRLRWPDVTSGINSTLTKIRDLLGR